MHISAWYPRISGTVRIEDQLADVEKDSSKFIMKRCTKIEVGKAQGCDPDVTVVVRCCSQVFPILETSENQNHQTCQVGSTKRHLWSYAWQNANMIMSIGMYVNIYISLSLSLCLSLSLTFSEHLNFSGIPNCWIPFWVFIKGPDR